MNEWWFMEMAICLLSWEIVHIILDFLHIVIIHQQVLVLWYSCFSHSVINAEWFLGNKIFCMMISGVMWCKPKLWSKSRIKWWKNCEQYLNMVTLSTSQCWKGSLFYFVVVSTGEPLWRLAWLTDWPTVSWLVAEVSYDRILTNRVWYFQYDFT